MASASRSRRAVPLRHLELVRDLLRRHAPTPLEQEKRGHQPVGADSSSLTEKLATRCPIYRAKVVGECFRCLMKGECDARFPPDRR